MKFDELLLKIGEFGPYQKRVFVLMSLVPMVSALIVMSPVFLLDIPNYRCAIPGYNNDTYSIQNDHHHELINLTAPLVVNSQGETIYSKCQLYNVTDMTSRENRTQNECNSWVYDTSIIQSSGITEFNMVCEKEILRSHSNMISFAGGLLGAVIFGSLADTVGRKKPLILSIVLTVATSVVAAVSPNYYVYITAEFIYNFAGMGLFMLAFVIGYFTERASEGRTAPDSVWFPDDSCGTFCYSTSGNQRSNSTRNHQRFNTFWKMQEE